MRPLVENGHIYIANAPLYIIKKGAKKLGYLKDDEDKDQWILNKISKEYEIDKGTKLKDLDNEIIKEVVNGYIFGYLKGLGEMDPEELAETTLKPDNRNLERVTIEDAEAAENMFRVLMDSRPEVVPERKKFIIENALEAHVDM